MSGNAPSTTFPFGLYAPGPTIRSGAVLTTGSIFYVSSEEAGRADDPAHGFQPQTPFATLAYAIGQATANNGDLIFVMAGHIEIISSAGGLTFGKAGVHVKGLGIGENRPILRLAASTNASIAVMAADILLENVLIDATQVDGIVNAVTVSAEDFTLTDSELYLSTSLAQAVLGIVTNANAHRLRMERCRFWGVATAGCDAFVKLVGAVNGVTLRDCTMVGQCAQALIWNPTANLATNLRLEDLVLRTLGGTPAIILTSAVTGDIRNVAIAGTTLAGIYLPGACASYEVEGYDESQQNVQAVPLPTVGTSLGAGRSIADELLGASLNVDRLNSFVVTADFTSGTWNTVVAHDIAVVTGCCRLRIIPVVTGSITSAGSPVIQFGESGQTSNIILSTDALTLLAGKLWLSISPNVGAMYLELLDRLAVDTTLGFELFISPLTAGTIEFHVFWEAISSGATVVAGTGATF